MIVQRIVSGIVAVAALAASAAVFVVAASFAVFSLLRGYVGPSGAAAILAGGLAVVLAAAGLFMLGRAKLPKTKPIAEVPVADQTLPQRLFYMLKERPVVAAGAAVGAGLLAWRNPRLVGTVMSLFALGQDRS